MENRLEFLLKQMEKEAENKHDELLDFSTLRLREDGRAVVQGDVYDLTDWASSQLCNLVGVPYRYYQDCPASLRQHNVNHWMDRMDEENQRLFRLRKEGDETVIRSILSEKYTKYDNHEVLHLVNEYLNRASNDYDIEGWHHDGDNFHLRVVFNDLSTSIGKTPDGKDDEHKVGIHVMNSEVGKSSIRIIPLVYRLICSNGLMGMAPNQDKTIFAKRHAYIDHDSMEEQVAAAMRDAIEIGDHTIDVLEKSKQIMVDDPYEVIDRLAKKEKYSKKMTEAVKDAYRHENDGSLFYVVQSLTDVAKNYEHDRRLEIETTASKLLQKMTKTA
ncbi:DUF932 domain-containing protein (plasmid) [Pontibacillus sp. ALD_SL1]|uniref:DUF932 domain-containing protein n=1 Tax=Pontibacillus sp. ALD_SL1 TaxID=2777185 RepID=UPI001A97D0B3|nr:DUF932 domain-containing protein [Pontibacillus sp. ALD_SL1]QST02852.1 DUF932 domain-containing protein [Pontibacillus sp. ALD_SL1]